MPIIANLFNYVDQRGDLTFRQFPWTVLDGLVLSRVAYIPFEGILGEGFIARSLLGHASERFLRFYAEDTAKYNRLIMLRDDIKLMERLRSTPRYRDLTLTGYINRIDYSEQKQFSALTVDLNDAEEQRVVVYRGTDNTLVGWKEDFNMSYLSSVPSQLEAVDYLETAAGASQGPLLLCGHSKGGNLAMFGASRCPASIQKRIRGVLSYDGPGLDSSLMDEGCYKLVQARLHSFIPQSSIVGMLFSHDEPYTVVASRQIGLLQHDPFTWLVNGDHFVQLDQVSRSSMALDRTIKEWLASLSPEQRERFIDTFYDILLKTEAKTLPELSESWLKHARLIVRSLSDIDEETKKFVSMTLGALLKAARRTAVDGLKSEFNRH